MLVLAESSTNLNRPCAEFLTKKVITLVTLGI
jgi:hypothetical protein